MIQPWFILDSGMGEPPGNMALDEALLEGAAALARPVLRFYGWLPPAASFGYSQRYREVARMTLLRPLIRRPTGGGLVPHDTDWTYAIVNPPSAPWYALPAAESYRRVHEWIQAAFIELGVETDLSLCSRQELPGQCFVGAEKDDLLWHGRKIAGAAQRRNKLGLLIQGSIQPPPVNLVRSQWQQAMCAVAAKRWNVGWTDLPPVGPWADRADELVSIKYARREYNERR